jgi:hypothetical protein
MSPEFVVNDDDAGFSIAVHHVSPEDISVSTDGETLHVSCKALSGDGTPFDRNFELPCKVVDPSMITANVSVCQQHQDGKQSRLDISVPKDALKPALTPGGKSSSVSIPVQVGHTEGFPTWHV